MTHTVCIPFTYLERTISRNGRRIFVLSAMGIESSKDWFYVIQVFLGGAHVKEIINDVQKKTGLTHVSHV